MYAFSSKQRLTIPPHSIGFILHIEAISGFFVRKAASASIRTERILVYVPFEALLLEDPSSYGYSSTSEWLVAFPQPSTLLCSGFWLSGSNHFHEHFPCLVRVLDFVRSEERPRVQEGR